LNSGLPACRAGSLHLQSILLWLFLEMVSHELVPQADLKPPSF
jgi:hypothetical protein